jgi:hypothetical protein
MVERIGQQIDSKPGSLAGILGPRNRWNIDR